MRRCALLGNALLAVLVGPLTAQSSQEGSVFDSLRTSAPVPGAEVVLLPGGTRLRADAGGRFALPVDLAGATRLVFWAPWLDSLGLRPLEVSIGAGGRPPFVLATPSPASYARARCGTVLGTEDGILVGEVRDLPGAPQAGVVVAARWRETHLGRGTIQEHHIATTDTTTESGAFSLCGVPRDAVVTVQALGAGRRSGARSARLVAFVERLDLVVGRERELATIAGRVMGTDRGAIANARLTLRADSAIATQTDSLGEYRLTVPLRSGELDVRAVGFAPLTVPVDPADLRGERRELRLEPIPPELERVVVTADPYAHERRGFEERRRGANGFFLTDADLVGIPDVSANVIANKIPRLRALDRVLRLRRGSEFCAPRFFRDGIDEGILEGIRGLEQVDLLRRAKRIEVYTANQAPPRYNDNAGCGAIVVWTR